MRVVLHKPNGTTITYKDVTAIHGCYAGFVEFSSEQHGRVTSTLPCQINHDYEEPTGTEQPAP